MTTALVYMVLVGPWLLGLAWFLWFNYQHAKRMEAMKQRPGETAIDWSLRLTDMRRAARDARRRNV